MSFENKEIFDDELARSKGPNQPPWIISDYRTVLQFQISKRSRAMNLVPLSIIIESHCKYISFRRINLLLQLSGFYFNEAVIISQEMIEWRLGSVAAKQYF